MGTDTSGLSPEQQALFASIMGNSSQQGACSFTMPGASAATPAPAPTASANSNRQLSQAEIDALIASMGNN
jgi:hypothetical protein